MELNESEVILLNIVGKLKKQDTNEILKNIGIIGSEEYFAKALREHEEKKQLTKFRNLITTALIEYSDLKQHHLKQKNIKLQNEIADLKSQIHYTQSEVSMNVWHGIVILVVGFFSGLLTSLGIK